MTTPKIEFGGGHKISVTLPRIPDAGGGGGSQSSVTLPRILHGEGHKTLFSSPKLLKMSQFFSARAFGAREHHFSLFWRRAQNQRIRKCATLEHSEKTPFFSTFCQAQWYKRHFCIYIA